MDPTTNGHDASGAAADVMRALRATPRNVLVFRGFGTLVAGTVLVVLMLWLAPSVAPEHVIERPVTASTSPAPVTTATTAPATTVPG